MAREEAKVVRSLPSREQGRHAAGQDPFECEVLESVCIRSEFHTASFARLGARTDSGGGEAGSVGHISGAARSRAGDESRAQVGEGASDSDGDSPRDALWQLRRLSKEPALGVAIVYACGMRGVAWVQANRGRRARAIG